jgi:hypothetical protein
MKKLKNILANWLIKKLGESKVGSGYIVQFVVLKSVEQGFPIDVADFTGNALALQEMQRKLRSDLEDNEEQGLLLAIVFQGLRPVLWLDVTQEGYLQSVFVAPQVLGQAEELIAVAMIRLGNKLETLTVILADEQEVYEDEDWYVPFCLEAAGKWNLPVDILRNDKLISREVRPITVRKPDWWPESISSPLGIPWHEG